MSQDDLRYQLGGAIMADVDTAMTMDDSLPYLQMVLTLVNERIQDDDLRGSLIDICQLILCPHTRHMDQSREDLVSCLTMDTL